MARKRTGSPFLPDGRIIGPSRRALLAALYNAPGFALDADALYREVYQCAATSAHHNGRHFGLVRLARIINEIVGGDAVTFSGRFKTPGTFRLTVGLLPAGCITGRPRPNKRSRPWSIAEDAILREMASDHPAHEIAAVLAERLASVRTAQAIYARRLRLRLPPYQPAWTRESVAALFGIDIKDVVRKYVAGGLLRGRKETRNRQTVTTRRNSWWRFDDEAVRDFIRRYPWEYDVRRMPPGHRMTRYALSVHGDERWLAPSEVRVRLGVSRATMYKIVGSGRLDNVKSRVLGYGSVEKYAEKRISTRALGAYLATRGGTGHGNGERGSDGRRRTGE